MQRLVMMQSMLRLAMVLVALGCASDTAKAAERPNVLMIVVDDMNDWVSCLGGHPQVKTPNIDRLAGRGLLFTNAHVPAPVCNPCRVSVMTGRRPSSTGICDDLPPSGKAMAANRRGDLELVIREGKYREMLQAYMANISFADALIGQLLDALEASPAARNTIIVLWSDHGWHLGEKQHLHKFTLWERSTRVPFIIAAPNVTQANTRTARPVGLIDLFPTLNDLCALPSVDGLEGQSLVPLLKKPTINWDRPALTTHGRGNHSLRTERWRYIRYADGGEELYDHTTDPNEWRNITDDPELVAVKAELARSIPQTDAPALRSKKKTKEIE